MGNIEDSILGNYKKALETGNLNQARVSVILAKKLKDLVENEGFIDYEPDSDNLTGYTHRPGSFFRPFPYRYYPEEGVVVISNSAINLTNSENKLFYLLSQNESSGDKVKIITRDMIKSFLWNDTVRSKSAIRILIKRLRNKIEPNPVSPQILLNYNKKGYIFVGNNVNDSE